ncbi:unnamed protein product [[Actinomadura] parvosata subsp. kistnae]|uniref:HTH tetR-type domain-containing protein n=1 Tax=[Actinomadura] parvosata subsp. kistnae TaxID=1909395 RepID=A0A1U9ZW69_9ACTN|nr:hypothetical protein [Nonomuraea sp. ATCC 55076]AQZ62198.1 hypothetical protein BKM31_12620 [Nonomuraea sp. ATCC 55076]SPL95962.1 unnamed protein product [Actinomadura parvosata subsp. kistnae]
MSRTTIHRNFATREELAATVLADDVTRIEQHAAGLLDRPDGVVELLDLVLDMQPGRGGGPPPRWSGRAGQG